MKTNLQPIGGGVNLLTLEGVTLTDLDDVDSWLFAIDIPPKERNEACLRILADGSFSVCNIEHRVEVNCRKLSY